MHCITLNQFTVYLTQKLWILDQIDFWGRVTHICVSKLTIISSENGLSPGHRKVMIYIPMLEYFNWTLGNKLQWNLYIFIQENAFETVVRDLVTILLRPQRVEAVTKWSPNPWRQFQMHFLEWKYINFTEVWDIQYLRDSRCEYLNHYIFKDVMVQIFTSAIS